MAHLVGVSLIAVQNGAPPSARDINCGVCSFLGRPCFEGMDELGLHPLDIFHSSFCDGHHHDESSEPDVIIPTAMELRDAGIHFRTSDTPWLHDVDFENGVLIMPKLDIDESSEKEFLNLMVFEQLHSDAGSDVINYLFFMDHIIDSKKDVALLRSKGIIVNMNDKEVADLFNVLTKGATSNPTVKVADVKRKVNAHYAKSWNKWRAFFRHIYLRNPWVFISLVAGVILLVATLLQTVCTVVPFVTKKS